MKNDQYKISVVIPVYNSAAMLPELLQRIGQTLTGRDYQVVLVDDGSKDESWQVLETLKQQDPSQLTIVQLSRNYGQHNALVCGFGYAKGDVLITMDDDLQHPPEEIVKLLARYEETNADVVYGEYIHRQQDIITGTGSYIFNKTAGIENMAGRGSSFRLMKAGIVKRMTEGHQQNFYFIDQILSWYTSHLEFVPVEHHKRKSGKSGYSKSKLTGLYFNTLVNYSATPLKLMTYGGIAGSAATFIIAIYFIVKKVFFSISVPGFTAIIVAILFTASIMLLCFGIIGQYLYRIMQHNNRKPPFSVKKIM